MKSKTKLTKIIIVSVSTLGVLFALTIAYYGYAIYSLNRYDKSQGFYKLLAINALYEANQFDHPVWLPPGALEAHFYLYRSDKEHIEILKEKQFATVMFNNLEYPVLSKAAAKRIVRHYHEKGMTLKGDQIDVLVGMATMAGQVDMLEIALRYGDPEILKSDLPNILGIVRIWQAMRKEENAFDNVPIEDRDAAKIIIFKLYKDMVEMVEARMGELNVVDKES